MLTRPPATLRPCPSPPPPRKPADAASNARELLFAQVLAAAEALPSHPPHEKPPGRGLTEREDGRLWLLRRVHLGTRWPQPGPGTRRLPVGLVGGWKGRPPACDYGAVTMRGSLRRAGPGAVVSHAPRSGQACPGQAPAAQVTLPVPSGAVGSPTLCHLQMDWESRRVSQEECPVADVHVLGET